MGATESFTIHHAGDFQNATFDDIQKQCIDFLDRNGDETILMNIQQEHSDADSATFSGRFSSLADANYWTYPTQVPTLGNLQKKIVLVRTCRRNLTSPTKDVIAGWDWPGHGLEWNGFAVSGWSWNDVFTTQNFWHGIGGSADGDGGMGDGPGGEGGINGTDKGNYAEQHLDAAVAGTDPGKIYLNFLSRADTAIGDAAADINARVSGYIADNHPAPARLGVLPMDFCGNTGSGPGCLEDRIISRNTFTSGTVFVYPTPDQAPSTFTLKVTVSGQPGGWMVEGSHGWAVMGSTDPIVFEAYQSGGDVYFKVKDRAKYLSVSSEGQVGLYDWNNARTFKKEDEWLFSDENGQPLRVQTGGRSGELWCSYQGDLLDVAFVPA
jgi:hypothetical protein